MTLQEIRKNKGFTQEKAAKLAGIPLRSYKRLETDSKYENTIKYKLVFDTVFNAKVSSKKQSLNFDKKITIVGAGYVGLASGILLSKKCKVEFVDIDKNVCQKIRDKYDIPCYESIDDIDKLQVVIISLPTNFDEKTKKYNTTIIDWYVKKIFDKSNNALVVIRSTVSVGYTDSLISKHNRNIVFMPEFLREATAFYDAENPNRIIVGANKMTQNIVSFINTYVSCTNQTGSLIKMSTKEAEATKLFSNAYLATRLAFFNEVDSYSLDEGLNARKIIQGMGSDPRIGDYYNEPSCGYSGYCLPKDTKAIKYQTNSELLNGVIVSNEKRKEKIASLIINKAKKLSSDPTIGFYGYNLVKTNRKLRPNAILDVIEIIKNSSVKVIVFDENYPGGETNFNKFIKCSTLIVTREFGQKFDSINRLFIIKK